MGPNYCTKKAKRMSIDDGTKITIRVSNEDIQAMEDYMDANNIDNRSDLIRELIRSCTNGTIIGKDDADAVVIHLSPVVMQTLENMKADGTIYDAESYIRQLIMSDIIPKDAVEDSKSRAFAAAQQSSRIM